MSGKASGRVWDLDLPHSEMLVLQAMADHADHQGRNIYPGMELIAWKTGYSLRQVLRIVDHLTEMRVLQITEEGGGRGNPTVYEINFDNAPQKQPYRPARKGDKMSRFSKTVTSVTQNTDILNGKGDILSINSDIITRKMPLTVNPLTVKEPSLKNPPNPQRTARLRFPLGRVGRVKLIGNWKNRSISKRSAT